VEWRGWREGPNSGKRPSNGAQKLTQEKCIVCGERAGNVAILHIVPRRFCFRSHPRSFSAPSPFCLVGSSLFRESFSRQECARTLSSAMVRQRGVIYDLTEHDIFLFPPLPLFLSLDLSFVFSLSLDLSLRKCSRRVEKNYMHRFALFLLFSTIRVRMSSNATISQSDCRTVSRFMDSPSFEGGFLFRPFVTVAESYAFCR
jgi:hypothetical protein